MTVLIFFLVLFVLILVHEWGHFIAAKKTGMKVDEFGIGFPPKLFGIKKGETEYTFNIFPIGGFVRILGENAEEADRDEDHERSFVAKPKWAQAVVLVAGVTMNIIFAWFLFVVVLTMGVPTSVDEITASPDADLLITSVMPSSPASEAGLRAGTEVVSVSSGGDLLATINPTAFRDFTAAHADSPVDILTGENTTITVVPQAGLLDTEPERVMVGVQLSMVEVVSKPITTALYEATVNTGASLVAITTGITKLIVDSLTWSADVSQVAGPIGIVGLVGDAAQFGLASLLMFTAIISLNLAVINMLPFPALDGGRLLFVAIEAVTKKQIKPVWVARLNLVGFALLILLMVAVTYNDILRIL